MVRPKIATTRDGLTALAVTRRQEIDGFIEGIFGGKEAVDLPERAHRGVSVLGASRDSNSGSSPPHRLFTVSIGDAAMAGDAMLPRKRVRTSWKGTGQP